MDNKCFFELSYVLTCSMEVFSGDFENEGLFVYAALEDYNFSRSKSISYHFEKTCITDNGFWHFSFAI